jgi:hypothetical protein
MQKVFNHLKEIEEVVIELLPPRMNRYIGSFKLEFKLSSNGWKELSELFHKLDYVVLLGERGIKYYISKATVEEEIEYLTSIFDEYYQYSDSHEVWKKHQEIKDRINELKKQL